MLMTVLCTDGGICAGGVRQEKETIDLVRRVRGRASQDIMLQIEHSWSVRMDIHNEAGVERGSGD